MQGWKDEHLGYLSTTGKITCFMVIKEEKWCCIIKAKYISTSSCCAQILWMKTTLNDFGIKFKKVSFLRDNESAIKLTKNLVQHARTKHIDVRHYFIRDHQQKGDICIKSVSTKDQLVNIFTKPLDEKRFCKLRNVLNIRFLKYVLLHTHLYDMPLLRAIQSKSWLAWHTSFAKNLFSASSHYSCFIGSFMKIK
jgi:hypothetical protein